MAEAGGGSGGSGPEDETGEGFTDVSALYMCARVCMYVCTYDHPPPPWLVVVVSNSIHRPTPKLPNQHKQVGMGTFVLALTLGILARAWLSPRIKLPYTSVVLMLGA